MTGSGRGHEHRSTHVDIVVEADSDQGSIPCASIEVRSEKQEVWRVKSRPAGRQLDEGGGVGGAPFHPVHVAGSPPASCVPPRHLPGRLEPSHCGSSHDPFPPPLGPAGHPLVLIRARPGRCPATGPDRVSRDWLTRGPSRVRHRRHVDAQLRVPPRRGGVPARREARPRVCPRLLGRGDDSHPCGME